MMRLHVCTIARVQPSASYWSSPLLINASPYTIAQVVNNLEFYLYSHINNNI